MDEEKIEKILKLSQDVLNLDRNTLLVNLRFLDCALSMLKLHPTAETTIATDGEYLLYDPRYVLSRYKQEKESSVRDYLHIIMHCIFRHSYVHSLVDRHRWNLACDIAVEYAIYGLGLKSVRTSRELLMEQEFKNFEQNNITITAEKLYRYFLDQDMTELQISQLRGIFLADSHDPWYMTESEKAAAYGTPSPVAEVAVTVSDGDGDSSSDGITINGMSISISEQEWADISERIQTDIEMFGKSQGVGSGSMLQNLKEVNREKYDYTDFLKKFAVLHEAMTVNDDEFDYIFYTYGLKLYKKVPLVEPLEYKDVKRIREFVIAIDTSGSTSGDLVQKFIQKTYNIIKSTESFASRVNIHIIQCDAEIQEDAKITNQEEFDNYLRSMQIRGLGGTDFRPVFSYVDNLIDNHEFTNLKGLIYFTDGWGTFPSTKPKYETAFVFMNDDCFNPEVPPWAIKLVLQRNEI